MSAVYAFYSKLACGGYAYYSTDTLSNKPGPDGLEFRKPSQVNEERFAATQDDLDFNYIWIDNENTYYDWTCVQGWALVNSDFARQHMSHWLKKHEFLISSYSSFTGVEIAAPSIMDGVLSGGNSRNEYLIETITNAIYIQNVTN